MLVVNLPYTFNKSTMYSFINAVIDSDMIPKDSEIKFNFNNLNFIEPSGVTILSNLIEWLRQKGVQVIFTYPEDTITNPTKGIKYLDDSMFFQHYLDKCLTQHAEVRSTTMPLKLIDYDESYQWIDFRFIPWLSERLLISPHSLTDIKVSVGEIFNNIRDHAGEKTGCIFAQHYPNKKRLKISISDFGIGIPNTIRREYPSLNDEQALRKAIEEGVSSKSSPRNRGAGLKTLLQNVVINYGGTVQIRTYSGVLNVKRNEFNDFVLYSNIVQEKYPGTFIEITFDTSQFIELPEKEEEFVWDW